MTFPAPMEEAAFAGPIGEAVLGLEKNIEACREALLVELLVFVGSAIGRTAYVQVGRTRHYPNEYIALVGATSRSRKGSTRDVAVDLVRIADPSWAENGVTGGATSGEGIVAAVRDRQTKRRKATSKEKKEIELTHEIDDEGYLMDEIDPGVGDKRRVFDEGELAGVFKVCGRDGNTLSERLRSFYDHGRGEVTNKNSPMRATDAHVSLNGHITAEELRARLTELDAADGWGNRFVYCATHRVRRLPGTSIDDADLARLARPVGDGIAWAREREPALSWEGEAYKRWVRFYNEVPDDVAGLVGKLTARSEAHVLRLSMIYAVADRSTKIRLDHLEAALAVWAYCERSVAWIWGEALGNRAADRICAHLRAAGRAGLSRTAVRDLFSHSKQSGAVEDALALLVSRQLALSSTVTAGARSAQWWWATEFSPNGTEGTEGTEPDGKAKSAGPKRDRSGTEAPDGEPSRSRSVPRGGTEDFR